MAARDNPYRISVSLIGPEGSSKSTLAFKFFDGSLPTEFRPSIVPYMFPRDLVVEGTTYNLQIWGLYPYHSYYHIEFS